ncbi:hypothetical protein HYDPIDRAFT_117610 [Hydnomerulius pinastri MD-312]|uniref:Uncharacterized protein n=1 Tax=Hydnomerulius pinastri MD-312 TaxID=994086 RepID=A0A0C9V434_9AGAM|nr:hypothetical protein HYDPIDRAFT_117610 [Hydnomerulius pinastri MD-312]
MSLFRLPFIVATAAAFHISATSPKKPDFHEKVQPSQLDSLLRTSSWISAVLKSIYWTGAVAETASAVASYIQHAYVPKALLFLRGSTTGTLNTVFIVGSVLAVSGGLIRLMCHRALGRFYTLHLGKCKGHALITGGPYSIVRHPGYTGSALCYLGILTMHMSSESWMRASGVMGFWWAKILALTWISFAGLLSVGAVQKAKEEDRMMRDTFKVQWIDWAKVVRYRLVPGVY